MVDRLEEDGTTRYEENGTTVRILEGDETVLLNQVIGILYGSTKDGTSFSNIRFEEIDKVMGVELQ